MNSLVPVEGKINSSSSPRAQLSARRIMRLTSEGTGENTYVDIPILITLKDDHQFAQGFVG